MARRAATLEPPAADLGDLIAHLLILDDDPGIRDTLAAILRHDGYAVRTAGQLDDALAVLGAVSCDLILADLHCAGDDGRDLLAELRDIAPHAIIIVLTSYATLDTALHALRAGAYAYLSKPTDIEELRLTVVRGLERRRLERELAQRVAQLESANAAIHNFNTQLQSQVETATRELQRKIAALDDTNQQLRAAQQQHERFVAMVAHDLRGPLGLVMSYAQLTARPGASPEFITRYTNEIIEAATRLNRLVDDLQTATKLNTGHFDLRRAPCDLVAAVEAAVEGMRTTVPTRRFSFTGQPNLGLVEVDSDRVLQAVRNLLDNAVKYSVENGAISVGVSGDADSVYISVQDEGAGIPEDEMERILLPFERGAGSGAIPGSGLGLSITRGIATYHGGELRVQNGDGPERARGAIFTLVLPRTPPPASSSAIQ